MDDKDTGILSSIQSWWSAPFKGSGGSALNWVLFVGLVVIAVFLWNTVLITLTKEI